ncbi:hypothetical protein [Paenibacillus tepidiphilus]|uniref:hypothetical protein n=1 Tax=Paenibacillus tepidiphilus TaxID=2608683 RepID=UPI00123B2E32|nr:hypothetical protein [Paenibacillus tepidiphilus]
MTLMLTGCGVETASPDATDKSSANPVTASAAPSSVAADASALPGTEASALATATPETALAPAHSALLLEGGVTEYSGSETQFKIDDEYVPTSFSGAIGEPIGLYLPDTMKRFAAQGGTAWGTADRLNYIRIVKQDTGKAAADTGGSNESAGPGNPSPREEPAIALTLSGQSADLLMYKEYTGYVEDDTGILDMFAIESQEQAYSVAIRTTEDQRSEMLPLFLEMLRSVHYMVKLGPLEAGVFLQEPDVGNDPGKKQAVREVMTALEAIAARDEVLFASTMKSPEAAAGLHHFLENEGTYHFYQMTVMGIPFEDEKWAGIRVEYYWTSPEGYVIDRGFTAALLPDKQGAWKIADLD